MKNDDDIHRPQLHLADSAKEKKVRIIVQPLILLPDIISRIKDVFECEIELGLSKQPDDRTSCLQMENTHISELPDGSEIGEFLALDLGGTNLRVIHLHLKPPEEPVYVVKHYAVQEQLRRGKCNDLFDFLAACIYDFMKINNLLEKKLPLGFCFSFPVIQKSVNVGIIVSWASALLCPDAVGKDPAQLLNHAISRRKDIDVHVAALVNDSTGTLITGAYLDKKCAIGFILGTGSNACYLEQLCKIQTSERHANNTKEVIVNTEMGCFGDNGVVDFIRTDFDRTIDAQSKSLNTIVFEKFVGGKFVGEIVRQVLLRLISSEVLFQGILPPTMAHDNSFTSTDISQVDGDDAHSTSTKSVLQRLGVENITPDDVAIVKYACAAVTTRSAILISICLSALMKQMNKSEVTIAVDGSLYKHHPTIHKLMLHYIKEFSQGRKFQLLLAEDGSGKGAGLAAAVATRLQKKN